MVSLVRIVQHPFDDLSLRIAVWNFISLAMHKEPALAGLLDAGHFRFPADVKRPDKYIEDKSAVDSIVKSQ
jgi:nuclear pore complex protein Nup188